MNYTQAMKWGQKHPRGTRQTVIMHTDSPWPAPHFPEITCPTCGCVMAHYTEPCDCGKTYWQIAEGR